MGYLAPGPRWLPWPWTLAGAVLVAAAVTQVILCARLFRKHHTTIKPFQESAALLTEGPYRFSRNPIYLAMILLLAGIDILMGTLTPLLVIPAFAWLITTLFITKEEQALAARFGLAYDTYRRRVRRWL